MSRCVQWASDNLFESQFTFFVSLNIVDDITPAVLRSIWAKVTRCLRKNGVICLWVCEVSRRSNRYNFHLLLRSQTPAIKKLLKEKLASLGIRNNIKSDPFDHKRRRFTVRYMTKAKTPKYRSGGLISSDRWRSKRVLFIQEHKIRKYGYVGEFFPNGWSKEKIWSAIIENERRIKNGLLAPGAETYIDELHGFIDGYYSHSRVRRCVGYFGVPAGWLPAKLGKWDLRGREGLRTMTQNCG